MNKKGDKREIKNRELKGMKVIRGLRDIWKKDII